MSSLTIRFIDMQGMMVSKGPIEIVTLAFPSTPSREDMRLFDSQLDHCKYAGLPLAHGWTIPHRQGDNDVPQECAVVFTWASLDDMYDVKSDEDSLFNNGFVPLRNEASEVSRTVLYAKLQDVSIGRSYCALM